MLTNPKTLSWIAPQKNSDGSPIDYELAYEVGLVVSTTEVTPLATFPGRFAETTADGDRYTASIADLNLDSGQEYTLVMRTLSTDTPQRMSVWSDESVSFFLSDRIPAPPFSLELS